MFDRETRREKIIEAKQRELKLKTKSSAKAEATQTAKDKHAQLAETEARMIAEAEKEFDELIVTILIITYFICIHSR
jgi:dynein intermediate chain 2